MSKKEDNQLIRLFISLIWGTVLVTIGYIGSKATTSFALICCAVACVIICIVFLSALVKKHQDNSNDTED